MFFEETDSNNISEESLNGYHVITYWTRFIALLYPEGFKRLLMLFSPRTCQCQSVFSLGGNLPPPSKVTHVVQPHPIIVTLQEGV